MVYLRAILIPCIRFKHIVEVDGLGNLIPTFPAGVAFMARHEQLILAERVRSELAPDDDHVLPVTKRS